MTANADGEIAGLTNGDGEILAVESPTSANAKAAGVPSAGASLDAHFAALESASGGSGAPAGPAKPADGTTTADPVPPAKPADGTTTADPVPPADPPPAATPPPPSDDFNAVALPPNARGATAEAFARVKAAAQQRVESQAAEITKLRAELEEARKAGAEPMTDAVKAELAELRSFREKLAVSSDPVFENRFGKPVSDIENAIFNEIKTAATAAGADGAAIEEASRKLGVDGIDWEALYKSSPALRSRIELKRLRRDELLDNRRAAEERAKADTDAWQRERATHFAETDKQRFAQAATQLDGLFGSVEGLQPAAPPAGAPKEVLEGHRAYVGKLEAQKAQIRSLVVAGDPRSIAELGAAAALTVRWQSEALGARAALASTNERISAAEKKATDAEKRAVEAETKLATIQKATRIGGNFPRTGSRDTGAPAQVKPGTRAEDAMDSHFKSLGIPTSG